MIPGSLRHGLIASTNQFASVSRVLGRLTTCYGHALHSCLLNEAMFLMVDATVPIQSSYLQRGMMHSLLLR